MQFSSRPFSFRDKVAGLLLVCFTLSAFTIELYWLLNRHRLPALADTQLLARMFRLYSAGDRHFFDPVTPLPVALEVINVYFTQVLNLWLLYAIVLKRAYRYPLQLALGAYVAYSVILYFVEAHVSGYAAIADKSARSFFILYAPNLPWLLGHIYLAVEAFLVLTKLVERAEAD